MTKTSISPLVIFGATGKVGGVALQQALNAGVQVRAMLRDPNALEIRHDLLEVIEGDILDAEKVYSVVEGAGAVLSAIGGRGQNLGQPRSLMTLTAKHITEGMNRHGVKRLVTIGTQGLLPHPEGGLIGDYRHPSKLINAFNDHKAGLGIVMLSGLDWTTICPPHMPEHEPSGEYVLREETDARDDGEKAWSGDVGLAAWQVLSEASYIGKRLGIASKGT